jgi:hypothetical protein
MGETRGGQEHVTPALIDFGSFLAAYIASERSSFAQWYAVAFCAAASTRPTKGLRCGRTFASHGKSNMLVLVAFDTLARKLCRPSGQLEEEFILVWD